MVSACMGWYGMDNTYKIFVFFFWKILRVWLGPYSHTMQAQIVVHVIQNTLLFSNYKWKQKIGFIYFRNENGAYGRAHACNAS